MHVGRRVAKLREAHGESLREAAVRTGVSHTTIARIEKGEVVSSFQSTLRKIAEGYGVRVEFLLAGKDPRQDFEFSLSRLSPEERSRLYFAPVRNRLRMVLKFLLSEYSDQVTLSRLSSLMSLPEPFLQAFLENEGDRVLTNQAESQMTNALSRMTGIAHHWFRFGTTAAESREELPSGDLGSFLNLVRKAADAGVNPEMLEMAIDLLILKQNDGEAVDPSGMNGREEKGQGF